MHDNLLYIYIKQTNTHTHTQTHSIRWSSSESLEMVGCCTKIVRGPYQATMVINILFYYLIRCEYVNDLFADGELNSFGCHILPFGRNTETFASPCNIHLLSN